MTVQKHKDMNWKYYIKELARNNKVSEIELYELCGYLLKRDIQESVFRKFMVSDIWDNSELPLADLLSTFLTTESPESSFDLLQGMKKAALEFYGKQIDELLEEAREEYAQEKRNYNPKDEYCPDIAEYNRYLDEQK